MLLQGTQSHAARGAEMGAKAPVQERWQRTGVTSIPDTHQPWDLIRVMCPLRSFAPHLYKGDCHGAPLTGLG